MLIWCMRSYLGVNLGGYLFMSVEEVSVRLIAEALLMRMSIPPKV